MEHDVTIRELRDRTGEGRWVGSVVCVCGWSWDVGPDPDLVATDEALRSKWADHIGSVPDPRP